MRRHLLVDAHRARLGHPAELLTAKAYTFYVLSSATTPRDEARLTQAFDTYAEARQADPNIDQAQPRLCRKVLNCVVNGGNPSAATRSDRCPSPR